MSRINNHVSIRLGFMGPVMEHLREAIPGLPQSSGDASLPWSFDASDLALTADFYNKILPYHPILNMEYSLLCTQLCHDFSNLKEENKEQITGRLVTALLYSELLEQIHLHYLVVPREVVRLRQQQQLYRTFLAAAGYSFTSVPGEKEEVRSSSSWSRWVSNTTIQANWYRILMNRGNRIVNLWNNATTDAQQFNRFVGSLDQYSNPFLAYFNLYFHTPRLLTNLFLMTKHTIPGFWMSDEEKSLAFQTRLIGQVQRRWFEMGNDAVWTAVSVVNIFFLVGAFAAGAVYLSAAGFAFDMINSLVRISLTLNRLATLKNEYTLKLAKEEDPSRQEFIRTHLAAIDKRIEFERVRLGIHAAGTVIICAAMILALPVFAVNPALILASAFFLVLLWAISFEITRQLEKNRPNEVIEQAAQVSQLGFFSANNQEPIVRSPEAEVDSIDLNPSCSPAL